MLRKFAEQWEEFTVDDVRKKEMVARAVEIRKEPQRLVFQCGRECKIRQQIKSTCASL